MLALHTLNDNDIDFIVNHLWQRGEEEAVFYGLKNKEELRVHIIGMSQQYGYCFRVDDEPVAAFGAAHSRDDNYSTWFIATDRFEEVGKQITRFLRGFVKEKVSARPNATLELISAVGHPDAERWFRILGFQLQKPRNGVFSRYLYTRPQKGC